MVDVKTLYVEQIRSLPPASRLQLLALIANDLAAPVQEKNRRITDLAGLGKELWQGIDAQEYVEQLRREWDDRP
jgi:hypothetical protein